MTTEDFIDVQITDNSITITTAAEQGAPGVAGVAGVAGDITSAGEATLTNKTIADLSNEVHADLVHAKVKNATISTITAGQPVIFTGFNVGEDAIEVALGNNLLNVSIGLAEKDILSGEFGPIIVSGLLHDVDTSAYAEGAILYVDGTGLLTDVEPTTGYMQPIAYVYRSHAINGILHVQADYPKQDADDVRYTGTLTAIDVRAALDELNAVKSDTTHDHDADYVGYSYDGTPILSNVVSTGSAVGHTLGTDNELLNVAEDPAFNDVVLSIETGAKTLVEFLYDHTGGVFGGDKITLDFSTTTDVGRIVEFKSGGALGHYRFMDNIGVQGIGIFPSNNSFTSFAEGTDADPASLSFSYAGGGQPMFSVTSTTSFKSLFPAGGYTLGYNTGDSTAEKWAGLYLHDDAALSLGNAADAVISYDGVDLVINPQVVGTGVVSVLGKVTSDTTPTDVADLTRKDYVDTVADHIAAPATATSAGTAGNIAYDTTHIYVCIAADTWVRSPLTTW